jgi:hypothetical protein
MCCAQVGKRARHEGSNTCRSSCQPCGVWLVLWCCAGAPAVMRGHWSSRQMQSCSRWVVMSRSTGCPVCETCAVCTFWFGTCHMCTQSVALFACRSSLLRSTTRWVVVLAYMTVLYIVAQQPEH